MNGDKDDDAHVAVVFHEISSKEWGNPGLSHFLAGLGEECIDVLAPHVDVAKLDDISDFLSQHDISKLPNRAQDAFFCFCMVENAKDALRRSKADALSDKLAYKLFTLGAAAESAKLGSSLSLARRIQEGSDKGIGEKNRTKKIEAAARDSKILAEFREMLEAGIKERNLVSEYRRRNPNAPSESTLRRTKRDL